MKYDDASWHYGGEWPEGLPPEAASTHIGMFVTWCWLNGMAGEEQLIDSPDMIERITSRSVTPGGLFIEMCDEKFIAADLNDEGNAFAQAYYNEESKGMRHKYYDDLDTVVPADLPSVYHLPDTWETFDKIAPVLDERFKHWRKSLGTKKKKFKWKF